MPSRCVEDSVSSCTFGDENGVTLSVADLQAERTISRVAEAQTEFPIHSIVFLNFPCPASLSILRVKLFLSKMNTSLQKVPRITSTSTDMSTRIRCLLEDWERMK